MSSKNIFGDDRAISSSPKVPTGFDPHQSMRHLSEYVKWLEDENADLKRVYALEIHHLANRRRELENENQEQAQEVERLKQDLLDLIKVLEDRDSSLAIEIQKSENLDKIVRRQTKELNDLETKLTLKIKQADMLKTEHDRLLLDNERLSADRHRLESKVNEQEQVGDTDRIKAASAEKESRRLSLELSEVHGKFALAENRLEELEQKHAEEIKKWQERLQNESSHELTILKKRLSSNLDPDFKEADKLISEKLSAEACSNYRFLVNRIIAKLNQAGFVEIKPS